MATAREITVTIKAIDAEINFSEMSGEDEISRPFRYSLLISCKDMNLRAEDVLGTPAAIAVAGQSPRYFHGLIADFELEEIRDDLAFYRMTLRPPIWLLSLQNDNRIFQNKSVIEIAEDVTRRIPEINIKQQLASRYDKREYCVQYGESDLDFLQRLLEHEGIFYFFEHEEEGAKWVLCDSNSMLQPHPDTTSVPYEPDSLVSFRDGDFVTFWRSRAQINPGAFAHSDYNFEKPSLDLMSVSSEVIGHKLDGAEVYRYPGNHMELARGDALANTRREELQADHIRILAKATARQLWPGRTFKLELFPREMENTEYLVVRVLYRMWDDQVRSNQSRGEVGYETDLVLSPTRIPFRPERRTLRPQMKGPQTAVVVGPAGSEIFTDKFARVKVQFFWDRQGKKDENTSCFVRVSSVWAGAGWGFIQIPRIGQEVIVDFLEGDPDQPIITGRVYNNAEMPPYGLPDNATQSGWKSNSSPGGGGWNELRFEDKKGSEEVYFQAEKDHNELVKNNESRQIGNDFSEDVGHDAQQSIGNDRTESVAHDKSVSVGNNRVVQIGVNDDETVGSNRSLTVGSTETIAVGANSTETIGIAHTQTVGAVQTITVGAARIDSVGATETRSVGASQSNTIGTTRSVSVGSSQTHQIGGDDSVTIAKKQTTQIGSDQGVTIGGGLSVSVAKDNANKIGGARATEVGKDEAHKVAGKMGMSIGKDFLLEAGDSIVLKCGSAAVTMKKDGTITIEGKDITVNGSGKINIKASGEVTVKGSKINNN